MGAQSLEIGMFLKDFKQRSNKDRFSLNRDHLGYNVDGRFKYNRRSESTARAAMTRSHRPL